MRELSLEIRGPGDERSTSAARSGRLRPACWWSRLGSRTDRNPREPL